MTTPYRALLEAEFEDDLDDDEAMLDDDADEFGDDAYDEFDLEDDADPLSEPESERRGTPRSVLAACLPDRVPGSDTFARVGRLAPMFRDRAAYRRLCRGGLWYMPGRGKILWSIARLLLKANGSDMRVSQYLDAVRDHPFNEPFKSKTGRRWPTRAFLPRWQRGEGRTWVGRGGGYGLLFFPPPGDVSGLANPYNPGDR